MNPNTLTLISLIKRLFAPTDPFFAQVRNAAIKLAALAGLFILATKSGEIKATPHAVEIAQYIAFFATAVAGTAQTSTDQSTPAATDTPAQ